MAGLMVINNIDISNSYKFTMINTMQYRFGACQKISTTLGRNKPEIKGSFDVRQNKPKI